MARCYRHLTTSKLRYAQIGCLRSQPIRGSSILADNQLRLSPTFPCVIEAGETLRPDPIFRPIPPTRLTSQIHSRSCRANKHASPQYPNPRLQAVLRPPAALRHLVAHLGRRRSLTSRCPGPDTFAAVETRIPKITGVLQDSSRTAARVGMGRHLLHRQDEQCRTDRKHQLHVPLVSTGRRLLRVPFRSSRHRRAKDQSSKLSMVPSWLDPTGAARSRETAVLRQGLGPARHQRRSYRQARIHHRHSSRHPHRPCLYPPNIHRRPHVLGRKPADHPPRRCRVLSARHLRRKPPHDLRRGRKCLSTPPRGNYPQKQRHDHLCLAKK